jgi:hypothetical protein
MLTKFSEKGKYFELCATFISYFKEDQCCSAFPCLRNGRMKTGICFIEAIIREYFQVQWVEKQVVIKTTVCACVLMTGMLCYLYWGQCGGC